MVISAKVDRDMAKREYKDGADFGGIRNNTVPLLQENGIFLI